MPKVPQDVRHKYTSMNQFDTELQSYAALVCQYVVASLPDLTSIIDRLDALEAATTSLQNTVINISNTVNSISASAIQWVSVTFADSPYTIPHAEMGVLVDTSGGAVTINLPLALPSKGSSVYIKDYSGTAGTNAITVVPTGTDTIDSDATLIIGTDHTGIELKASTTDWSII